MKILIIDGFARSPEGRQRFKTFYSSVVKAFNKLDLAGLIWPEYIVRNANDINDYLYDPSTMFADPNSKSMFEKIDLVIIDGEVNLMPWFASVKKIGIFFKSCKLINLHCIAAGMGFNMLIYFCATGYKNIDVINGHERGTRLDYIKNIDTQQIRKSHAFLDNSTGDFYSLSQDENKWKAIGNCGLHYIRSSETFGSIGSFFQKSKQYHAKPLKDLEDKCLNMGESIAYVKRSYIQHWALKSISMDFKIPQKNKWDSHPVNIALDNATVVNGNYTSLVECDRGPVVIEHGNMLAFQFHIDPEYPESILILENFLKSKIAILQNNNNLYTKLESALKKERIGASIADTYYAATENNKSINATKKITSPHCRMASTGAFDCRSPNRRPSTTSFFNKRTTIKFIHSGQNYSKRREGELYVRNNAFGDFNHELLSPQSANQSKIYTTTSKEQSRPYTRDSKNQNKHRIERDVTPEALLKTTLRMHSHLASEESI